MFFGSELPLSLYFPVLLLGTRSLEIKALGTALEVVEVDVLEDDAIWGAERPSHKRGGLSLSFMHTVTSAACQTIFEGLNGVVAFTIIG